MSPVIDRIPYWKRKPERLPGCRTVVRVSGVHPGDPAANRALWPPPLPSITEYPTVDRQPGKSQIQNSTTVSRDCGWLLHHCQVEPLSVGDVLYWEPQEKWQERSELSWISDRPCQGVTSSLTLELCVFSPPILPSC